MKGQVSKITDHRSAAVEVVDVDAVGVVHVADGREGGAGQLPRVVDRFLDDGHRAVRVAQAHALHFVAFGQLLLAEQGPGQGVQRRRVGHDHDSAFLGALFDDALDDLKRKS